MTSEEFRKGNFTPLGSKGFSVSILKDCHNCWLASACFLSSVYKKAKLNFEMRNNNCLKENAPCLLP